VKGWFSVYVTLSRGSNTFQPLCCFAAGSAQPTAPQLEDPPSNAPEAAEANPAVASAALQLLSHLEPNSSWARLQEALCCCLQWPDGQVRQAAEEACLAALAHIANEHPRLDIWPAAEVELAAKVLSATARSTQPPFCFTEEELWETQPVVMDLWLVRAALGVSGLVDVKGFTLDCVVESTGWVQLKAWTLGYAAGVLGGSANARQKGRWDLRFKCAVQLAKWVACSVGQALLGEFCRQWGQELAQTEVGSSGLAWASSPTAAAAQAACWAVGRAADCLHTCQDPAAGRRALRSEDVEKAVATPVRAAAKRQCGQCGQEQKELQWCSGCKGIKYCDAACQKAHWKLHKKECKALQQQRKMAASKMAATSSWVV
jgi:hypothetical protein